MNIVVVPDKFKGSLTTEEVISGITSAIKAVRPSVTIKTALVSDGGDGFLASVADCIMVETIWIDTVDALNRPINAPFLFDRATKTAYVELAKTAGLVLLKNAERNPLKTTTRGVGIQVKKAIALGAKTIYLGLGGSATNDGATGLAEVLGYRFLDANGQQLFPKGEHLDRVVAISGKCDYNDVAFYAVNDVNNPLFGPKGAAHVYGAQKGADKPKIEQLDNGLRHLADVVQRDLGKDMARIAGSGAAGGTGYGLKVFFDADFLGGAHFLLQLAGIPAYLEKEKVSLIITGEGMIDAQTLHGKLIQGVLELAKQHQVPVLGVCGKTRLTREGRNQLGLVDLIEIGNPQKSLDYNMKNARELLRHAVTNYFKRNKKWS